MKKEYRDENGKYHREDGPALEWPSGKFWYIHGEYHREDGPAKDWDSGHKEWWIFGKWHREDGPALEWKNGDKSWYDEGKWIMFTEGPVTEAQLKLFRLRKIK